jgi:hypothetical protein
VIKQTFALFVMVLDKIKTTCYEVDVKQFGNCVCLITVKLKFECLAPDKLIVELCTHKLFV